jgi:hypothetical protein
LCDWKKLEILETNVPDRLLDNLMFGINSYLKTPRLWALLTLYIAVTCTCAMMITGTVVYVNDIFGKGGELHCLCDGDFRRRIDSGRTLPAEVAQVYLVLRPKNSEWFYGNLSSF